MAVMHPPAYAPTMSAMQLEVVIDRESPVPLYHQLSEQLCAAISDGRLQPGDPFENEVAVAERLSLSRPTVRRAIQELVDQTPASGPKRSLGLIALVATLGSLLFGYDTGVLNGALEPMKHDLGLTTTTEGLVVSTLLIGAAVGALLCGRLADAIGRRKTMIILAIVFFVGTLGAVFANDLAVMLPARFVLGLAVGGAFMVLVDIAARTLVSPAELPIGVVTAAIGAPFFLVVLRRSRGQI